MAIPFLKGIGVAGTVDLSNLKIGGAQGTDGQVLTSTGTGIAWEDAAAGTSETAERIEVTVKNVSGGSLSKGTVVHASPSATPPSGNVIEVIAADYDDSTKMPAIGILNETIADTAEGSAVMMGAVSGIDTSSFSIGDELYVGNLGALTNTKPTTAGQLIQKIAVVIKSHASNGVIKIFGAGRSNDVPLPLYIDNTNQRVGIGDSTPSYTLDVNGTIYGSGVRSGRYYGTSGTSSYLDLDSGAPYSLLASSEINVTNTIVCNDLEATEVGGIAASNGPVYGLRFYGYGNTTYYVDPNDSTTSAILNGKVGIGTTSPAEKFHVNGKVRIGDYMKIESNANYMGVIGFNRDTGNGNIYNSSYAAYQLQNQQGKLLLQVYNSGGSLITQHAFDNSGNLGINTTTPGYKLDVNGTVSTNGGKVVIRDDSIENHITNGNATIAFNYYGYQTGSTQFRDVAFYNGKQGHIMTIDGSSSSVGIGTATPSKSLHVKSSNNEGIFMEGTGGGHWFDFKSGTSNLWSMGAQSGLMGWYNRTDSSYKMVITDSGNVGINTTSPSHKLEVNGTAKADEFVSLVNTSNSGITRDWTIIGTGDRGAGLQVNDISGAKYAIYAGGYDLTFGKHVSSNNTYTTAMAIYAADATDGSPYVQATHSFRAPIFYDSSNSNFNWDPGTDNSHRFTTPSGYIDIGPKNTSWCHIYTDRNGFYFNKTTFQLNGNQVWHAGNDGSGSTLDADLLDGLHASSFLRSDANDTWSGDISTASTNGIRFGSANQTDTNDGYIAAGRFASGLNIVGTQTTAGTGRQIRLWGNLITNDGNAYWHAGNDGSGSGLDADLLDGVQGANYFKKGADIGGSQNLNNYTTDGYYHQNANANASSGSNYPVSAAGMLSVVSDGSMVYQTYHQYNGNAYYHRSYYNGTWYAWRKVWQDGNDGSGSGLDADTVDGIQGASFLRSDANDSFTGSELHFPTLDLSISNNNAQNQGNTYFRGTGTHFVLGLNNGNTCYLNYGNTSGALRLYGSSIYWNDSNIGAPWGSGNDGSGSGLDADTVDGIQGGSFLRSDADDTATGVITINNDLYLGTYSGTTQARLFLNGTTANKQAKIQCTNGNLHIDSEDGHSLYLNYYEGTTDNVIIGNGNGGSSGTILKSTGRINVGEHLIAANNVYAGGSEGFVFGSSTSEGEYIKRNGSNIEFVAYGEIKFDITAQGVHVRTGNTYRAQISHTGIGRFANDVVAYYNFSDKRLKTNIKPTTNNLDKVLKLNPVEYNWKEGYRKDKKEIGLIAQEVEKIIPEVVRENQRLNDDTLYKQIDYEHLVSTLIGAVQEQQKQIDELKSIINGGS